MTVKEHYDTHLAHFYSWMTGDFETKQKEFQDFIQQFNIIPTSTKKAIDLGAGHGIQSVSLANVGFNVTAIDFNNQLLNELKENIKTLPIEIRNDDIKNVKRYADLAPELIVCCGDTLSHLNSKHEISTLLTDSCNILTAGGRLLLTFRDYSTALTGDSRFIPVKSDETRILTCILDYDTETVRVTDLLHEKTENGWIQKISSYTKVRLITKEILAVLDSNNMKIQFNQAVNRMTTILAVKQ